MNEEALEAENQRLREAVGGNGAVEGFVGQSAPVQKVIELVRKVAPYPTTVLVTGRSKKSESSFTKASCRIVYSLLAWCVWPSSCTTIARCGGSGSSTSTVRRSWTCC